MACEPAGGVPVHFDLRLWRMTAGLRGRIALGIAARPAGARRRHRALRLPRPVPGPAVPRRAGRRAGRAAGWRRWPPSCCAPGSTTCAPCSRTAPRRACRRRCAARLYDKIVALGPAWFGAERTGGVMLSIVDGVEQLQTFFGQYLPQVSIAACAPLAIFALHRVLGRAGRHRDAGAPRCSPWWRPRWCTSAPAAHRASGSARSRRSARSSSTRCRACRR